MMLKLLLVSILVSAALLLAIAEGGRKKRFARGGLRSKKPRATFANPEGPSQQCRDDAGPIWGDDNPNTNYYDNTPATPVGSCPAPLSAACARKGFKGAALDGESANPIGIV